MYKVKDFNQEFIEGDIYENDLLKVDKEEDLLWFVEEIINKCKRKGLIEVLVKFEFWFEKFNQWVKELDIIDLKMK